MAEVRKFLFDTEFEVDRWRGNGIGAVDEPVTRQHLAAARREGFEAGRQAGRAEAEAERARLETESLARIAREVAGLRERHAAGMAELRRENLALSLSIGRKLAGHLMAAQPLAEIEGLVDECLRRLLGEARIVVRIHGSLLDALQARVDGLARRAGFAGQIILLAEDELAPGDCRVEWADGGATRSFAALDGEIDGLVSRALTALAAGGGAVR